MNMRNVLSVLQKRVKMRKKCKKCGGEVLEDGYDYDICWGCHAKLLGLEVEVISSKENKEKD